MLLQAISSKQNNGDMARPYSEWTAAQQQHPHHQHQITVSGHQTFTGGKSEPVVVPGAAENHYITQQQQQQQRIFINPNRRRAPAQQQQQDESQHLLHGMGGAHSTWQQNPSKILTPPRDNDYMMAPQPDAMTPMLVPMPRGGQHGGTMGRTSSDDNESGVSGRDSTVVADDGITFDLTTFCKSSQHRLTPHSLAPI